MSTTLTAIGVKRFKAYRAYAELPVKPLTVLVGRNNTGKSSFIQALLLLNQTLRHPRWEIPLHLSGAVNAHDLRTLTHGWPAVGAFEGPEFTVKWTHEVDLDRVLREEGNPARENLARWSHIGWLATAKGAQSLDCELRLAYRQEARAIVLTACEVTSRRRDGVGDRATLKLERSGAAWNVTWCGRPFTPIEYDFEHFLPYITINKRNVGPRHRSRSRYTGYRLLVEEPLFGLRDLLQEMTYLGSFRRPPEDVYSPSTTPPGAVGVSGEHAAQLLHSRQSEHVSYIPALTVSGDTVEGPSGLVSQPLVEAVNDVLVTLGVNASVKLRDIEFAGFQLLFGDASVTHVGKGLSYLLPLVTAGLVAASAKAEKEPPAIPVGEIGTRHALALCAYEEPETHLHPGVQSRLAHWFVSQALSGRQQLVETHSDHLVRRLRGLIARSTSGSPLERWLLENVAIVEVDQADGNSSIQVSAIDEQGGIEHWPHAFMDEASDEEATISFRGIDKTPEEQLSFPEGDTLDPGTIRGST